MMSTSISIQSAVPTTGLVSDAGYQTNDDNH